MNLIKLGIIICQSLETPSILNWVTSNFAEKASHIIKISPLTIPHTHTVIGALPSCKTFTNTLYSQLGSSNFAKKASQVIKISTLSILHIHIYTMIGVVECRVEEQLSMDLTCPHSPQSWVDLQIVIE